MLYIVDGILVAVWAVLMIAGSALQFYTERGKPDFPVSPRVKRRRKQPNGNINSK